MSEADEMFKKIEYNKIYEDRFECKYTSYSQNDLEFKEIKFNKKYKQIDLYENAVYTTLYLEELQAIYKKCEELQWI